MAPCSWPQCWSWSVVPGGPGPRPAVRARGTSPHPAVPARGPGPPPVVPARTRWSRPAPGGPSLRPAVPACARWSQPAPGGPGPHPADLDLALDLSQVSLNCLFSSHFLFFFLLFYLLFLTFLMLATGLPDQQNQKFAKFPFKIYQFLSKHEHDFYVFFVNKYFFENSEK